MLIPYQEALELVLARASALDGGEIIPVGSSLGRRAHSDVTSILPNPPFSSSSVDGFAVRIRDLAAEGKPSRFEVAGRVCAGDSGEGMPEGRGICIEITTGAPLPQSFDAVVKVEEARIESDRNGSPRFVSFNHRPAVGENIRYTGEDLPAGEVLLRAGTRIRPEHLMALAASGIESVTVRRKPKVALLSTGQEVVEARGEAARGSLPRGKLFNSTAPYILSALSELGADADYYGIVADDPRHFASTFERMAGDRPDLIITTGAVSVGLADFVPEALRSFGAEVVFHRVAIRPGKPILFARLASGGKDIAVFGFPGNLISSVAGLRFFVAPYLRAVTSAGEERSFEARLSASFGKPVGLTTFCLGTLSLESGEARFAPWPRQMSFMLGPILHSNAWAILPAERRDMIVGDRVECRWMYAVD